MGELRDRMHHDMVVRGLSERTRKSYTAAVFFSIREPRAADPCSGAAPAIVQSGSVEQATIGFNNESKPIVLIRLAGPAGQAMRAYSRVNIGRPVSICLDGQALMSPVIRGEVGTYIQIDGLKTTEDALRVAAILNGGPLPERAEATRVGSA